MGGRITVAILFACVASAFANPVPAPLPLGVYIASERLTATFDILEVQLNGTFTFRACAGCRQPDPSESVEVEIPIWFPEYSTNAPPYSDFCRTFHRDGLNRITSATRNAFDHAISLKVTVGVHELPVNSFYVVPPDTTSSSFPWGVFQPLVEPGFTCLIFPVEIPGKSIRMSSPVSVSYRQPLLQTTKDARFFYLPIFVNLPAEISTTNRTNYSIQLKTTADCTLAVTNGVERITLDGGRSVEVTPSHHQPIRAIVKPLPAGKRKAAQ